MSLKPNPFPAYPVAMLESAGDQRDELTVRTPGIAKAEALIDAQLDSLEGADAHGLNASVRGRFGTGKTHLLGHARRHFLDRATLTTGLRPGVVSLGGMESSPVDWYRSAIGRQVATLDLEGLVTDLYAEVAIAVARRTPLTAAAVPHLDRDSATVHSLLRDELLSSTSVQLELIATLERIAGDVGPQVRAAIEGLISQPKPSLRWLEGQPLSDEETIASGLSRQLDSDSQAADVLVMLAALHAFLHRPFLLLIDELEHFVRLDVSNRGKANVTWLKRLLERLAAHRATVFVAGHISAWEGHPDYLDRFSPQAGIELEPLDADDVIDVVERFEGERRNFGAETAALVAETGDGNIRRVLGLLHELHDLSDGFEQALPEQTVLEASTAPTPRVDSEQAIEELSRSLTEAGLRVSRRTTLGGLSFDVVAYRGEVPVAVVEVRHALFGKKQQEQAQRFLDKLRIVNRDATECVGIFASEGSLDPALLEIDSAAARVCWFDLTEPDFSDKVRLALERLLAERHPDPERNTASERDAAIGQLVDDLQEIKALQAADYARLEKRLEAPAPESGLEFRPPSSLETHDEKRAIFEELSVRPPFVRRLGMVQAHRLMLTGLLLIFGIGLLVLAAPIADSVNYESADSYVLTRATFFFGGAMALLLSIFSVFRELLLLDRFYAFKRERLREVYVLDASVRALVDTNRVIDQSLYRHGPRYGVSEAIETLGEMGLLPEHMLTRR